MSGVSLSRLSKVLTRQEIVNESGEKFRKGHQCSMRARFKPIVNPSFEIGGGHYPIAMLFFPNAATCSLPCL